MICLFEAEATGPQITEQCWHPVFPLLFLSSCGSDLFFAHISCLCAQLSDTSKKDIVLSSETRREGTPPEHLKIKGLIESILSC